MGLVRGEVGEGWCGWLRGGMWGCSEVSFDGGVLNKAVGMKECTVIPVI